MGLRPEKSDWTDTFGREGGITSVRYVRSRGIRGPWRPGTAVLPRFLGPVYGARIGGSR